MTEPDHRQPRRRWLAGLSSYLLGAATGMTVNQFSGATAYRAIAVALTVAALATAVFRLHDLPPRAPLVRYAIWTMLALGLAAATFTLVVPPRLAPSLISGAVGITAAAVSIPVETVIRMRLLTGAAAVGLGVAATGSIFVLIVDQQWLDAIMAAMGGAVMIGFGAEVISKQSPPLDALTVTIFGGWGIALIGSRLVDETSILRIVAMAIWTIMYFASMVLIVADRPRLRQMVAISLGIAVVGFGTALITNRQPLGGAAFIGFGISIIGYWVTAEGLSTRLATRARRWFASITKDPDPAENATRHTTDGEKSGRRSSKCRRYNQRETNAD